MHFFTRQKISTYALLAASYARLCRSDDSDFGGIDKGSAVSVMTAYQQALTYALQVANVDANKMKYFYMVPSTPTDLGSVNEARHNAAVYKLFDGVPNDNEDPVNAERTGSFSIEWNSFSLNVVYPSDNSADTAQKADASQRMSELSRSTVSLIIIIYLYCIQKSGWERSRIEALVLNFFLLTPSYFVSCKLSMHK